MRVLAGEKISTLVVRYDPNGSLVTTHKEQGSDLGLSSGILGWTPDNPRLPTYEQALKDEVLKSNSITKVLAPLTPTFIV